MNQNRKTALFLPPDHPFRLFRNFVRVVWKHLGLPAPTPIQLEVCDYLQFGPQKLIIQGFRGMGKSYLTAAYAAWSLFLNPQEMIMALSASKDRADLFTKFTRRLIDEIPCLRHLRPDPNRGDQDSSVSFQVGCCVPQQSPSVVSRGITGQITGSRATIIIPDDIEVPNNSETPTMREKLVQRIEEFSAILVPKDEERDIIPRVRALGTPQTEQTVYNVMQARGYQTRIWPIMIPSAETKAAYGDRLAPSIMEMEDIAGTPTEPLRFGGEEIASRQREYGKAQFALQFMLDTSLSDAERYPLKIKDAMFAGFDVKGAREVYVHSQHPMNRLSQFENVGLENDAFFAPSDAHGEVINFETTIVAVDPSGRGADETGVISLSALSGYVFVHNVIGLPGGYDEPSLERIARECKRVNASKVVVESNFGDGMFSQLLRPVLRRIHPCSIEEVRHTTMKERRIIDTLSPVFENHRIIFNDSIPEKDRHTRESDSEEKRRARQLFYQLTRVTYEKGALAHDDRLDALAMGVAWLNPTLNRDAMAEQRAREEEELQHHFDKFEEGQDVPPSWISYDIENYHSTLL